MNQYLDLHEEVADALSEGRPVVALESTIIAYGMPYPANLETAGRVAAAVRAEGAVPATVGLAGGRIKVGLDAAMIERFAHSQGIAKVSRRDFAPVLAGGGDGATTVAGTMIVAALAGIPIFATGGIGGVHRGAETTFDISADLTELARSAVAVVSAGAKAILDLPKTLEVLETEGVPVIGYGTSEFPAFYVRTSGLALDAQVDTPETAARAIHTHRSLGLGSGVLIANPIPAAAALKRHEVEHWIEQAIDEAEDAGIAGKDVTPYLLDRLQALSGDATLNANRALIEHNARVAAQIAVAYAAFSDLDSSRS